MTQRSSDNLIKHGSIMLAATVIGGMAHYLYHVLMIRLLSPADYGALYSLLALFMIIGVPSGTVTVVITKYISRYKAEDDENRISLMFERSLKAIAVCGLAIFLLFAAGSGLIRDYLKIGSAFPVIMVGAALTLAFVTTVPTGALQGLQRFLLIGVVGIGGAVGKVVVGSLCVLIGWGVTGALSGIIFASGIGIAAGFIALRHYFHYDRDADISLNRKEIFGYFVPVAVAIFCYGFLTYYDALIVKHHFDPAVAGYYSTCALIGKAFLFPPAAFAAALFPKVSELHAAGKDPFPLLNKSLLISTAALIAGAVFCTAVPRLILDVLLHGKEITYPYADLVTLMRVFGWMVIPYGLLNLIVYFNLAMHRNAFLYMLVGGGVLLIALLTMFHDTLLKVITIFGGVGYGLFLASCLVTYMKKGENGEGVSGQDIYCDAGV